MEFYISPDRRQELERKLDKMFKHLDRKPNVEIGNAEQVVKTTITDLGCDGFSKNHYKIQACYVKIEDIETDGWTLVATVAYDINSLLMSDSRYFKQIPEQYGLSYTKCDHCGSVHKNRKESHILYNPEKDQWMQVGSTCVNKMLNGGKYLNNLMLQLYNIIKLYGGCDEEEWEGGFWRPSNKYMFEAVRFDEAMMVCEEFKKKEGHDVWFKAEYEGGRKVAEGTNDALMHLFGQMMREDNVPAVDTELFNSVKSYYDTIPYGDIPDDEYGYSEKTLTQKIKDAFADEYINLCEMYLAWFAIANYKSSLEKRDFETMVTERGYDKGVKLNIVNAKLLSSTYTIPERYGYYYNPFDAPYYDCVFDADGVKFNKHVSNMDAISKYGNADGTYSFCAEIKYIGYKKQMIYLGGRLSKINKL